MKTRLYQLSLAIVLISVFSSIGMLEPSKALAQGGAIENALTSPNAFIGQVATAKVQMPASVATRLRKALSQQTKISAAKLKLIEATPKTWANGCLGLAKADELCTQALVNGWRVVFSNGTQRWIYRTDKQGRVYRLEP